MNNDRSACLDACKHAPLSTSSFSLYDYMELCCDEAVVD